MTKYCVNCGGVVYSPTSDECKKCRQIFEAEHDREVREIEDTLETMAKQLGTDAQHLTDR